MPVMESVGIALFLMAVVFAVLVCLYLSVRFFSFVMGLVERKGNGRDRTAPPKS